jgi:CBS domain-containing protein
MSKFEQITTVTLSGNSTKLPSSQLPEIVHLNDSAFAVMSDFSNLQPHTIDPSLSMTDAINEMKIHGVHFLLVKSTNNEITGLITSEDLLGAKPIQIIEERRVDRSEIKVKMLMTPINKLPAFHLKSIRYAKVGNVVETLQKLNQHYALVIDDEAADDDNYLCGMFSTWQISQQLHTDIADSIDKG